jgi:hypothetical protein
MEGKLSTYFPHYSSIIEGHRRKTNNHLPHCILGDVHNISRSALLLKKYTFNLYIGDHYYLHLGSWSFAIFADWLTVDCYCGGTLEKVSDILANGTLPVVEYPVPEKDPDIVSPELITIAVSLPASRLCSDKNLYLHRQIQINKKTPPRPQI